MNMKENKRRMRCKKTSILPGLIFCFVLFALPAFGQIIEEPAITDLMSRWRTYNLENQEVQGWRIQILATVDRRQSESTRRDFENKYPDFPLHFVHNEPYYHLKVGAFVNTQRAQAFLKKMQADYPQSITVTDMVKIEELLLYDQ